MIKNNVILRILSVVLIVTLAMSLCACKENPAPDTTSSQSSTSTESVNSTQEETPPPLADNPKNFDEIKAQYPNACAWIKIPGIDAIDYHIMISSPEMDDNFYIDHDIDGKPAKAGSLYIQKHNSTMFDDPNTVIYGHNMGNGTMFGQLKKYRDKAFFDEHKTIFIYIPGHILEYETISAFVYDNRHILNSFEFNDPADRMIFFDTCVNPDSLTKQVREGATLDVDDKIITLSTCVPTGDKNYRYLVIGKLIKDTPTK